MDRKINIPMALACVLLCLTLITTHMTGGLFARYTTTAQASDSARVAKFQVAGTENGTVSVQSDTDSEGNYSFEVINHSEVAITYDLEIVFTEDVTDWLDLEIGTTPAGEDAKTFTFADAGTLPPGEEATHEITFKVTDWSGITSGMSGEEDTKNLSFTVNIHAEQID